MSLWRVKHTLSPVIEYALIAMVATYGLFGMYLVSLKPVLAPETFNVTSWPTPVTLDIDAWERHDNATFGYAFAAPPGWLVDLDDPADVRLGRSGKEMSRAPASGGIAVHVVRLGPRQEVQNLAALEFAGTRPALYDSAIDGREALFAVEFVRGRVARQVVYVPMGETALVFRATTLEPAAFATFVSTVKFYVSETNPAP